MLGYNLSEKHLKKKLLGNRRNIEHKRSEYVLYRESLAVFQFHRAANNWSWVPVVGGLLGGILGALIYIGFIEMHHVSENNGRTGYELESIVTISPETKRKGQEIGKANMAFSAGLTTTDN